MATDTGYANRDFIRICDICLHRFHISDLTPIGELRWACKDDAPGYTAMQVSRINARARPLKVRPNRWAKPVYQIPTYQLAEAATFNFIASVAPAQVQDGSSTATGAAWGAIYMADIINQGLRPAGWIATAKTVLKKCLTYLLTLQYGSPTGPAGTSDNPRYGAVPSSGVSWNTSTTIIAGLAFLKGYQALGDAGYLQAADRVATYLRHVQCGDLQVSAWTVYPSGGGPYHLGGLASGVTDATGLQATTYLTADIFALYFLALLVSARSPSTPYGDGAATSFFSAATQAPLSQMQAELLAFATTGVRDSTAHGSLITGLSSTTPRTVYNAAVNGAGGLAAWSNAATISMTTLALGMRGVYETSGTTSQVSGIISWLLSFTSNVANQTPAQPDSKTIAGVTGTYDPTLCFASFLATSAPFTEAAGALYDWTSEGIISPILAGMSPGLRRAKDTLAVPQRYSAMQLDERYIGPLGFTGLSLQTATRTPDVLFASRAGMIFRQPPGMYPRVALF